MTTTTAISEHSGSRDREAGYSLAEVLIVTGLFAILMAGITTSFLFFVKGTMSMGNYADINVQSRVALERFGRDVRMASITYEMTDTKLDFDVPILGGFEQIIYEYKPSSKALTRKQDDTEVTILKDVEHFAFKYFTYLGVPTTKPIEIKRVQMDAEMVRNILHIENTNHVISAQYMMRNRKVSS